MRSLAAAVFVAFLAVGGCTSPSTSPSLASARHRSSTVSGDPLAAAFSASCVFTTCTFTDQSTGAVSLLWSNGATTPTTSITFHTASTDTTDVASTINYFSLTVKNAAGDTSRVTHGYKVLSPIRASVTLTKGQGVSTAHVQWSGVRGDSALVLRQNQSLPDAFVTYRVANTGAYAESFGKGKMAAGYYYAVCEMSSLVGADWQCTDYILLR